MPAEPGRELCRIHQGLADRGEPVERWADVLETSAHGPAPAVGASDAPTAEAAAPPPELAELPQAPEPESWAPPPEPDPVDLEELDRVVAQLLGPEPTKAPPEAPRPEVNGAGAGQAVAAAAAAAVVGGTWTPERVAGYLEYLNPILERGGKPPLSREELREGGAALAPVCERLFGSIRADSPYTAAVLWVMVTFGSRYAAEIAEVVRRIARGRMRSSPTSEPPGIASREPSAWRSPWNVVGH